MQPWRKKTSLNKLLKCTERMPKFKTESVKNWMGSGKKNNIQYQSEKDNEHLEDGFPLPAFTFEEAFRSYAEDKDVGHLAKGILAKLNRDFKRPTAIQSCCWPALFTDRDILGISKTGSGKTLTFGLPTILKVAKQKTRVTKSFGSYCHALIVVPTRELANQHVSALKPFCDLGGISIEALIGGNQNFREQASKVESGQDILVCTVGRLLHFLSEDMLSLMNTSVIVLDEADEMLVGFEEGIREVLMNQIRSTMSRQCLLFFCDVC
jgi:superfamily II DNA/RNA helicase